MDWAFIEWVSLNSDKAAQISKRFFKSERFRNGLSLLKRRLLDFYILQFELFKALFLFLLDYFWGRRK